MKKNTSHALVRIIVIAAMLVLVVAAAIQCANGKSLAETAWSLLPPVIAIVLALISKEAYSSLFIGVVVGALFTTNFAPVAALDAVVNDGLIAAMTMMRKSTWDLFFMGGSLLHKTKNCVMTAS